MAGKTATITKEQAAEQMKAIDAMDEGEKIEAGGMVQMELSFRRPYSDIALREAVRGVKAITREMIRFGIIEKHVGEIMQILAINNPMIYAAVDAIEEQIERSTPD